MRKSHLHRYCIVQTKFIINATIWSMFLLDALTVCKGQNRLSELPESFGNLCSLRYCQLSKNKIELLPSSFGNLSSLEELRLDNNIVRYLSAIWTCTMWTWVFAVALHLIDHFKLTCLYQHWLPSTNSWRHSCTGPLFQYQVKRLAGKKSLRNDLFCVEWDAKS